MSIEINAKSTQKLRDYEKADEWCRDIVNRGDEMLFDVEKFDFEINRVAKTLNFPVEVREE
jgi:hypothetical protein